MSFQFFFVKQAAAPSPYDESISFDVANFGLLEGMVKAFKCSASVIGHVIDESDLDLKTDYVEYTASFEARLADLEQCDTEKNLEPILK